MHNRTFGRVRNIIANQSYIDVHESEITLDTHLEKDLKMDHSAIRNLVYTIRYKLEIDCTQEEQWEWENLRDIRSVVAFINDRKKDELLPNLAVWAFRIALIIGLFWLISQMNFSNSSDGSCYDCGSDRGFAKVQTGFPPTVRWECKSCRAIR